MPEGPSERPRSSPTEEPPQPDEWIVGLVLTVGLPLLICMSVFVVIVLAFSQWKLY